MYKANATSIREVTLEELLMRSELVFEGTVTNLRARQSHDGIIRTSITFTVAETITGKHPGRTLTLEFLGGTAGSRSTVISGMRLPEPGEHGIYFVEAVGRKQVNPFYGWSQGHFIVEKDPEGTERVMTNRGKPVIGIRDNPPATPAAAISRGVARGIVAAEGRASGPALSVQEFKASLRALISRQREANQLDKQP
ncbi:MAG TPA: hypothetical protein VET88_10750 [Gammaproteobacteria bacterium]|nr:hypothetical protein [Gammaproteobacteria bacterium]